MCARTESEVNGWVWCRPEPYGVGMTRAPQCVPSEAIRSAFAEMRRSASEFGGQARSVGILSECGRAVILDIQTLDELRQRQPAGWNVSKHSDIRDGVALRGPWPPPSLSGALGTTLEFSPPGSLRWSSYSSSEVGERPPGVPSRLSSVSARATSCSGVDGLSA